MCARLRKTFSRGRARVPATCARTRAWRRIRCPARLLTLMRYTPRVRHIAYRISYVVYRPLATTSDMPYSLRATLPDLPSLPGFAADMLAHIAQALALVRLRRAPVAKIGCHLAHQFLVDPGDRDGFGLFVHRKGDSGGRINFHRMGIAQCHDELLALELGPVTYALDLQALGETLAHAHDHVAQERARGAVERADCFGVGGAQDHELSILHLNGDLRRKRALQFALWAFDAHV